MISITVARLAIETVLVCAVAGIVAGPAAAAPETTRCATGDGNDPTDVIPAPDAPTTRCDS